jgi:hypothetical protein
MTTYQRWPFMPGSIQTPAQQQQWWRDCFVSTPDVARFVQAEASAVLVGQAGSGKSTAVAALQHKLNEPTLLIPYPPKHWPGSSSPWVPDGSHLSQILAAAATEVTRQLGDKPELFTAIFQNELQYDFLNWLVEKHLGRRALARLYQRLRQLTPPPSLPEPSPDIYDTTARYADLWNLLDELVGLTQTLGYSRTLLILDLNEAEAEAHLGDLGRLLGWLDLFEYPEFAIRAAIPTSAAKQLNLLQADNGRFPVIRLQNNETTTKQIIRLHLQVSTNGAHDSLEEIAETAVLDRAAVEIEKLYGTQAVAGWLQWTETLLDTKIQRKSLEKLNEVVFYFYQRHIPLQLETTRFGVWRGPQFISLDQQPYELLKKLFALRGQPNAAALKSVAGSQANLNKLTSRLRKEIEPIPEENLYLHNRRDRGYWLENFLIETK